MFYILKLHSKVVKKKKKSKCDDYINYKANKLIKTAAQIHHQPHYILKFKLSIVCSGVFLPVSSLVLLLLQEKQNLSPWWVAVCSAGQSKDPHVGHLQFQFTQVNFCTIILLLLLPSSLSCTALPLPHASFIQNTQDKFSRKTLVCNGHTSLTGVVQVWKF